MPAPVPGLLPADEVQHPTEHGTAPAQSVGGDACSPVDQAPSISANSALQPGMVNQSLTQLRHMGCAKSSAASETLLPNSQQPHPTAAFPGTGLQRESKGSLIALPVGLDCVGRSQMWEQMFAELQKSSIAICHWCKSLPCSLTHQPGLGEPCSCLGLGSPWRFPARQG